MIEYIERQAAIDAVHGEFDECLVWDTSGLETANVVENILDTIPPADVRPVVRGRWVPRDLRYGRSHYFCSACEMTVDMPTAMGVPMFRYCPHCGADLRGGDPE
jgi:hypothetical protein